MRLTFIILLLLLAGSAFASERCQDSKRFKDTIAEDHGQWIVLTNDQYRFAEGIFAIHPQTPAGLPYGTGAVLAKVGDGGMVFFTDGDKVCDPFTAPKELIDLFNALSEPKHEGQDN